MADAPRLPGVETGTDVDPIVLHVDADCFYAACERLREPALRDEPVVVGMGYEPGDSVGAVATASYEARTFGVESAMAITQALEALPRRAGAESTSDLDVSETGIYRPVDMAYYESVSEEVQAILHDNADVVREVSIDEAYLDVTERTDWNVAEGFARHVKERIAREVGVTVSIGVAPSMSAAKIASDFDKPDGLTVIEPGAVRDFLAPLDISEIHGVGPVTARTLREMGLETAGDVASADPGALAEAFGERGRELYDYSRGDDDRHVTPRGLPKSFSRESAFGSPVMEWERKRESLATLAEAVADRATREGALYRTVGVKAVTPPYDVNTRERSLSGPVDDPALVVDIATDLFDEFAEDRVRKLGVKVANLEFDAADQSNLDEWERTDGVVDRTESAQPHPADETRSAESSKADQSSDPASRASTDGQLTLGTLADEPTDVKRRSDGPSRTDRSGADTATPETSSAVSKSDSNPAEVGSTVAESAVAAAETGAPASEAESVGSADESIASGPVDPDDVVRLSDFDAAASSDSPADREHAAHYSDAFDHAAPPRFRAHPDQTTLGDFFDE